MRTQVNVDGDIGVWRECPTCTKLLLYHGKHFQNFDGVFEEGCVNDEAQYRKMTPDELLEYLDNR